jgi:hypothetical protein
MGQFLNLFEEFIMKAIVLTETFLSSDFSQDVNFENFTSNRDRLFQIIEQLSKEVDWNNIADDKRNDLNRQIEYIKKLDEKLLVKLQEYQAEVKKDIERTVRQKENIKGYNLSDTK